MKQISITIGLKDEKSALIEGARKLGLSPEELTFRRLAQDRYLVEMKNAPGRFEILAREDKMEALTARKIIFGINAGALREVVTGVAETGVPQGNLTIAVGEPPRASRDTGEYSIFTSTVYGCARIDWKGISVSQVIQIGPDETLRIMQIKKRKEEKDRRR